MSSQYDFLTNDDFIDRVTWLSEQFDYVSAGSNNDIENCVDLANTPYAKITIPSLAKELANISSGEILETWIGEDFSFEEWISARIISHTLDDFIEDNRKYSRIPELYEFIKAARNCLRFDQKKYKPRKLGHF